MKSAADWLKSSSDDDDAVKGKGPLSAPRPVVSAIAVSAPTTTTSAAEDETRLRRQREAEERRRQLHERMQAALGTEAVAAVVTSTTRAPPAADSPVAKPATKIKRVADSRRLSVLDSFTSDDTNSVVGVAVPSGSLPPTAPPQVKPLNSDALNDDEVVIMVANRGTQTATEVEVQTDPEPHTLSCHMCYHAYYGHVAMVTPPCGGGPHHSAAPVYQFSSGGGVGFQPVHSLSLGLGSLGSGLRGVASSGAFPSPYGSVKPVPSQVYQHQLDTIQRRIEQIIQKHNLPPMVF